MSKAKEFLIVAIMFVLAALGVFYMLTHNSQPDSDTQVMVSEAAPIFAIIGQAHSGDTFALLDRREEWCKIEFNGQPAWMECYTLEELP